VRWVLNSATDHSYLREADIQRLLAHPAITAAKSQHNNSGSLTAIRGAADSAPTKIDILLTHAIPDAIANSLPARRQRHNTLFPSQWSHRKGDASIILPPAWKPFRSASPLPGPVRRKQEE
jgi:hypothetical protein